MVHLQWFTLSLESYLAIEAVVFRSQSTFIRPLNHGEEWDFCTCCDAWREELGAYESLVGKKRKIHPSFCPIHALKHGTRHGRYAMSDDLFCVQLPLVSMVSGWGTLVLLMVDKISLVHIFVRLSCSRSTMPFCRFWRR